MRRLALPTFGSRAKARASTERGKVVSLAAIAALASICPNGALAQSAQVGGGAEVSPAQGASASTQAEAAPAQAPSPAQTELQKAEEDEKWRKRELRMGNTYFGPAGGIFVVDAGSGAPKSFRLQLIGDFMVKKDYLYRGDKDRYTGTALSLGVTPIKNLEFSAAMTLRANQNDKTNPQLLQSIGDLYFDVKSWGEVMPGFNIGGDAQLVLLSGTDGVGIQPNATSLGLRGNLSFDLRRFKALDVPLLLRFNGRYYFDNSSKLVQDTENARLANIEQQSGMMINPRQEYRNLARRDERLAFNVNRVDHFQLAVGGEMPLEINDRWAIHPIAEWGLQIPINRQNYDCAYITTSSGAKLGGTDSCLGNEGVSTWRQNVTVGARVYPVLRGLNLLAAVDIGVGGSTNFVQELAPNWPYRIMIAASYTADLRDPKPVVKEVEKRVEVAMAPPPMGHVHGTVVEQGTDAAIADAKVSFPAANLNPMLSNVDGTFTSYPFGPGEVQIEVDENQHYRPGTCSAVIPPEGGDVAVRCELVALPRVGGVVGHVILATEDGAPAANVTVTLTGPAMRTLVTDANGGFRQEDLPPGDYTAHVEQEGYLLSNTAFSVKMREDAVANIHLVPTPKVSSVKIQKDRIQIRGTIFFTTGTADLEARSEPLMTEIADAIMRNPEIQLVEIQGHTDDTGTPDQNQQLSQKRAEAVKTWLVKAGVERDRLVAKGYGSEKPIVPNLTPQNRAKNRRVEFLIQRRAGE